MKDIWNGYIIEVDEDEIICLLRKDYHEDKELTIGRDLLTEEQNRMIKLGLIMRFDVGAQHTIEFMKEDENWV
jgi:hypothetical protein